MTRVELELSKEADPVPVTLEVRPAKTWAPSKCQSLTNSLTPSSKLQWIDKTLWARFPPFGLTLKGANFWPFKESP